MKLKKIIGVFVVTLIAMIAFGVTNTYAANASYVLGITNVREDKGAYGLNRKSDGTVEKKIWKIVSYPNTGSNVLSYDNAFYCLKAEHGFMSNASANVTDIRKTYDQAFNMKTQKEEVMTRLNAIDVFKADPTAYNKVMWILDNMYLPKAEGASDFKVALLQVAGITNENYTVEHVRITDADIEVVQQMAIWYFTNPESPYYNGSSNSEKLPMLYFNNWSGKDEAYENFEDLYNDKVDPEKSKEGRFRQEECELLYRYFIDNAKTKQDYVSADVTSPLTLDKSRVTIQKEGTKYIVGPFKINKSTQEMLYTLKTLGFVDENNQPISYQLLDEHKKEITAEISSLYGKDFYISLPKTTTIKSIKFQIALTYTKTDATYYTTNVATYKDEQPVVLVERAPQEYKDEVILTIPEPEIFDLALRKFITKVNNVAPEVNRQPVVDITPLKEGTSTTAIYNHPKNALAVKVGDIVTYTIRVYNEGKRDGYVKEITDHLPKELEFLPDDEENIANGWYYDENDVSLRTIKTTHLSRESDTDNLLKAFDGTKLDYLDITVKCKVKENVIHGEKITNIADITAFTDEDGNIVTDIDSQHNNVTLPTDENLPGYKENEINRGDTYIPGQQDDDDFEKVKVEIFDLALRKFITQVNNLPINNRIPVASLDENGKITYNHTKEPVEVEQNDIVIYTLRIFNEGIVDGYAKEVTDDLPEGIEFLPENDLNKQYRWKMIDKDGNITTDVKQAAKITTDYLSKEQEQQEGANLIKAFDKTLGITENNPDYRDIKIAFRVTLPNTSDRIIINTAEISEDADKDNQPVEDDDSTPGNNVPGEDDIDIEKIKVKYFDLALKKWVSQAIVIQNGQQTVTETGHTGDENPEPIVKVDLKDKDLKKVTVKFRYKIKVTNEGQIAGYVKEIKDYIPDGLKFVKEDNPKWNQISEKVVTTTQAENILLKPGESTTVEILLTWINGDNNLGLKVNQAEISKDYNESNTPDIDSVPDNRKPGEDDIDDAPVMLAIKTGETEIYIGLTTIILVTLAGGVYLIKKFVL